MYNCTCKTYNENERYQPYLMHSPELKKKIEERVNALCLLKKNDDWLSNLTEFVSTVGFT